ncbi:MAG: ribosomal protein S18-alanine N-acetyltransferase [Candidatus Binataceae bacterium]
MHPRIIRDAHPDDIRRIVELERLAFAQPWSAEAFAHEFSLPFSRTIVAVAATAVGENLSGFLCRWLVADECHILNLAVHPESRRKGVGTILMGEVIAEAVIKKAAIITLEVRRSNLAARGLYRNLRFDERRVRKNYYSPGEDAIVMERRLAAGT